MIRKIQFVSAAVAFAFAGSALAAVSAEEAKQLGSTLTPWGAEKAGNKEGTIPEWTGQVKIPASYDPKNPGVRPDPFADEKPLFSIDAKNMDKYADKLSEGNKALMKKYPTYRIDVYPSHRTVAYPQYIIDNTIKNATQCKAVQNGLQLQGCWGGVMFPIPKSGNEVMWNHVARYEGLTFGGVYSSYLITPNGSSILQGRQDSWQERPIFDPARTSPITTADIYWKYRQDTDSPARMAGEKLLIQDGIDAVNLGRRVWQYLPGQRRVKLAPDLSYDTPNPQSGGASTMDEAQIFMGPQDRFDFKLIGKKELYIPYNNFKLADGKACPNVKRHTPHYANPDCVRWELHRVWHVVGTVKSGVRHIYSKREFYLDEDAAGAGVSDNYDSAGKVYRVVTMHSYPMYEVGELVADSYTVNDLATGNWIDVGNTAETGGWHAITRKPSRFYTGESLAGDGIR